MSDFDLYFMDPCELVSIVYGSDGIIELGRYKLRGYARSVNRFFQICSLIAYEVAHSDPEGATSDFEIYLSTIRDYYHAYVKNGEVDSLEDALQRRIDDLKQYKFKARRIFPFLPESDVDSFDRKQFEITMDHIFKWILKMRQRRINFYERVLQEYKARKEQYNQRLRVYLESEEKNSTRESVEFSIDSVLAELKYKAEKKINGVFPERYYEIHNQSWYLKDLLKLKNPEIERYTKSYEELPRYRIGGIHTHPEGLKAFFKLFSIFRDEMNFILPDEPNKSFFERALTILKRDFLEKFERQGDLEDVIVKYIEELEKYEFLSLPKEKLFDKLSKMIYNLRARRIKYYENVLEDYLANKEKYDEAI